MQKCIYCGVEPKVEVDEALVCVYCDNVHTSLIHTNEVIIYKKKGENAMAEAIRAWNKANSKR